MGGAFHDGRATGAVTGDVLADQAMGPFLNPAEMAMPDGACVLARVCAEGPDQGYPVRLADLAPEACTVALPASLDADCAAGKMLDLDEDSRAAVDAGFQKVARALSAFESSAEVSPFSSKFDRWQAGKAELTAEEKAGFDLFQDKGLCAECHVLTPGPHGEPALFTDFTYDNLGVPRNPENPWYGQAANAAGADWRDRGLAETLEKDALYAPFAGWQEGKQKVPTLRNVDARADAESPRAYMHNGYFKTLKGLVHFYNTRDVLPACDGDATEAQALAKGCWPAPEVAANVNHDELGNLKLSEAEENAIVAFMRTLTDEHQD
jgi:cytochrome c peroxidase